MEVFNFGFYGRELRGEEFKYIPEQRVVVKRKTLTSLPTTDSIININN